MFSVYVLRSSIKRYLYVGLTNNLKRRFIQHNNGQEKTTAPYRPFELVHQESFATRPDARIREKELKSGMGKKWLKLQYPYNL